MTARFSVVPAAYVYLRRGDSVLLQLRTGTGYMDGTWAAGAAGHIELGETAQEAARRELHEELGIEIDADSLEPLTVMQRTDGTSKPIDQRADWFFALSDWEGEPRIIESAKCAALAWHSLRDLPEAMPPHERFVLDGLAAGTLPKFTNVGFDGRAAEPRLGIRRIGNRLFDFERQVAVMAVINRTPDSFSDNGVNFPLNRAIDGALAAAKLGADWVDIGGVPFGRGPAVSVEEEIDRVVPVVRAISAESDVVISVDTNNARVARSAIEAGAAVINDTSGLGDPDMPAVVADSNAQLVITHSVGPPRVEKPPAHFDNVVRAVHNFLTERVALAESFGIPRERLIIDPGHDLDKNTLHSLEITRHLDEFTSLGLPVLAAVSNKDFIGEVTDRPQGARQAGSIAAMVACIERGARIVRMHDVEASVDAVRMLEGILGWRAPVRLEHNTHPTRNV